MKKFLIFLLFIVFINSSCDPGWGYYLVRPSMDEGKPEYANKYICINDSLNIEFFARDFAYGTIVQLQITTPLDSIEVYPQFSYIESPYFVDKAHIPDRIHIKCFSYGILKYRKSYVIRDGDEPNNCTIQKEAWEKGNIIIKEETERKTISKTEFLKPYILQKRDSLSVNFRYRSFAIYNDSYYGPSMFGRNTSEKSDFILCYNIYGNEKPIVFHFATKRLEKETK